MTPEPAAQNLSEAVTGLADQKVAFMVGAEGPGLTETAMRASDVRVRIPMSRGTDSLNVATRRRWRSTSGRGWCGSPCERESTPWGTGLAVSAFVAAITGAAMWC